MYLCGNCHFNVNVSWMNADSHKIVLLMWVHTWRLFWLEKVDERFFIKRKSCQHFGYKYQPRSSFVAITTAATVAWCCVLHKCQLLKLTGRIMLVHVCLVQEFRLEDARFHTTTCAPKLVRSDYRLPSPFFLLFLLLWKRLAPVLSLVSCQKLAWRRAYFFFRKA